MSEFVIKRIYEPPAASDGFRVLVDRLWPRGVSKERADLNLWAKDVAPSAEIRKEFGHKADKFEWFKGAYITELNANPAVHEFLRETADKPKVTLLYAAKDLKINHAAILREYLTQRQAEK